MPPAAKEVLSWDEYFMSVAFLSSLRSIDPKHRGGTCIVNRENRIVGIGYCGYPRGLEKCESEEEKRFCMCHSIMNAILNKNQYDIRGCRVYTTRFPCNECAKLVTQSGIARVTYAGSQPNEEASRILFTLAGVSLCQFTPKDKTQIVLETTCK